MIKSGYIIRAEEKVKLKRGNKVIERTLIDYQNNEQHFKSRGFSLMNSYEPTKPKENVVSLTKKVKKNVKKTKKKN